MQITCIQSFMETLQEKESSGFILKSCLQSMLCGTSEVLKSAIITNSLRLNKMEYKNSSVWDIRKRIMETQKINISGSMVSISMLLTQANGISRFKILTKFAQCMFKQDKISFNVMGTPQVMEIKISQLIMVILIENGITGYIHLLNNWEVEYGI